MLLVNSFKLLLFKGRWIQKRQFLKTEGLIFSCFECCFLVFFVLFTLDQLLLICWHLFLLCSFGGQKNEKPRHTGRSSRLLLCSKVALATFLSHFQPCHESLLVCFLGAAELSRLAALCASNRRSYSPRTISKKQTAFRCATYGAGFV